MTNNRTGMSRRQSKKLVNVELSGNDEEIAIDFGVIGTGYKDYRNLKMINRTTESLSYSVRRDELSPLLDGDIFELTPMEGTVNPGASASITVSYIPRYSLSKSVDYFDVVYGEPECRLRMSVVGASEPPKISTTPGVLRFDDPTVSGGPAVQNFWIENDKSVPAHASFALLPGVFTVHPRYCDLPPGGRRQIEITCRLEELRSLRCMLYVLVHNGAPRCIQLLVGDVEPLRPTPQLSATSPRFWDDRLVVETDTVDFGQTVNITKTRIQELRVANVTQEILRVEWQTPGLNQLKVSPRDVLVPAETTVTFEVGYLPEQPQSVLFTCLEALVSRAADSDDPQRVHSLHQVPVLGSFAVPEVTADPRMVLTPSSLIMPACALEDASTATCLIGNEADQALVFDMTYSGFFTATPTSGCIEPRGFAVLLVGCRAGDADNDRIEDMLQWRLNLQQENIVHLQVLASQESPRISWTPKTLLFPSVCRGVIASVSATVRNLTRSRLVLVADPVDACLQTDNGEVTLASNQKKTVVWSCDLDQLGVHEFTIPHRLRMVNPVDIPVGREDAVVSLHARVVILDGIRVDLSLVELGRYSTGTAVTCRVVLENLSETRTHVLLNMVPHPTTTSSLAVASIVAGSYSGSTSLPYRVAVPANGVLAVSLSITPDVEGPLRFQLVYQILSDESGTHLSLPKALTEVALFGYRPYFQITDIESKQGEKFLDKLMMWKMLAIDRINRLLKEHSSPASLTGIAMALPPRPIGSPGCRVAMLLENPGSVSVKWTWRVDRKAVWLQVEPKEGCLRPGETCTVLLTTRFPTKPGVFAANGQLCVRRGSELTVCVTQSCVTAERGWIFLPTDPPRPGLQLADRTSSSAITLPGSSAWLQGQLTVRLQPVELGCRRPPLQYVTLFNAGLRAVDFHVHTDTLDRLAASPGCWGVPVLRCLDTEGSVPAGGCVRIRILFRPIEVREYQVTLPICVDSPCCGAPLTLKARGLVSAPTEDDCHLTQTRCRQCVSLPGEHLSVSHRYIHFGPVLALTAHNRIIFLHNRCKDVCRFVWSLRLTTDECCRVFSGSQDSEEEATSRVEIDPMEGLIGAGETVPVSLTFQSGQLAQVCSHTVHVAFRNLTRERLFQLNYASWKATCERRRAEFTMTRACPEGSYRPISPAPQEPPSTYIPVTIEATVRHAADDVLQGVANPGCRRDRFTADVPAVVKQPDLVTSADSLVDLQDVSASLHAALWSLLHECELRDRLSRVARESAPFCDQLIPSSAPAPLQAGEGLTAISTPLLGHKSLVAELTMRKAVSKIVRSCIQTDFQCKTSD